MSPKTSVKIDPEIYNKAVALGLDVSKECEKAIRQLNEDIDGARIMFLKIGRIEFIFSTVFELPLELEDLEFIEAIHDFKHNLLRYLRYLCPKNSLGPVRVVFRPSLPIEYERKVAVCFHKFGVIWVSTEKLREFKSTCETDREARRLFLLTFIHEMAHFKFETDEQKTTQTANRILKLLTD